MNVFSFKSKKIDEEKFNISSFIHFPPNLLKSDYINYPGNPCYNEQIAHGVITTKVFIYTTIKLKNSIIYDMIKCALSKSQLYVKNEIIYQSPYDHKIFCQKTIESKHSHYNLHLWLEWSKELKLKIKNYQKDQIKYDFPFSCSPNVRYNNNIYVHMHLFGKINELIEDSGEKLKILNNKPSEYINLVNEEKNISSKIDSDILPFIVAKTITENGFGYNELILPDLMYQLFDFFYVVNLLTNQPKWKNVVKSNLNYMPPINRYDKYDVLQKEFAFIDTDY